MRHGAADEPRVRHRVRLEIVKERTGAGEELCVFPARQRPADVHRAPRPITRGRLDRRRSSPKEQAKLVTFEAIGENREVLSFKLLANSRQFPATDLQSGAILKRERRL